MSREIIFYVEAPVQRTRGGHEPGPGNVGPRCEVSVVFEIREFAQRILTQNIYKLREFRMEVEIFVFSNLQSVFSIFVIKIFQMKFN